MMLTIAVIVMIKVIIVSNRKKMFYVIRIFFLFIIKLSILISIQVRNNLIEIRLCGVVVCCFVQNSLALGSFFPRMLFVGVGNKF